MKHRRGQLVICFLIISALGIGQKKLVSDFASYKKLSLEEMDSLLPILKKENKKEFALLSEFYTEKAILLKEYEKAMDASIKAFYTINVELGETQRAIQLLEKTAYFKEQIKDTFLLGTLELKRGGGNYALSNYEKAINNYSLAIEQFGNTNLLHKADAYFFRGQGYGQLGKIKDAIESLKDAQNIYEKERDTSYAFYTMEQIAIEYERHGLTDKAISIREDLLEKANSINFKDLSANYYNLGNLYEKKGALKKYKEALLKAHDYINYSVLRPADKTTIYGDLAIYYVQNNDSEKAYYYLEKFYQSKKNVFFNLVDEASYYYLLAKFNFEEGKFDEALKYCIKAFDMVNTDKRGNQYLKSRFTKLLSEIHAKLKHWDKAYYYSSISKKITDSIENVQKTNVFAFYQSLYESEKKDKEIYQKNTSIALLEKDSQAKRSLIFYGGSSLVLLLLLTLSYQKRKSLKNEKKLQQEFSQKLLSLQEEERKRISRDLHDGLGQHLLFIKNNAINKKDNDLKQLSSAAIEEMRNISRSIHPFQLEQMGLTYTLENLVMEYDEHSNMMIFADIENIDGKLKPEKEISLYRIIQECLTNMVKHSNAQSGKLEIKQNKKSITVSVFDNGKGFNYQEKFKTSKSLGLKTIKERLESIGGKMKIVSNSNQGSQFIFTIPA